MYSLLGLKRFYFGLSLLGSVVSQFLVFKYFRSADLTYFITMSAVFLAVMNSYTSSASAALQYNPLLFSHNLSFRLMMLPILVLLTLIFKLDNLITAILFALLSVDSLIPFISNSLKYYRDLVVIKILSITGFLILAFDNIFIAYLILVFPVFIYLLISEKLAFVKPYGNFYNVLSVILILSYTQLNYFLPLEVPDGINVFGLLDRASMLIVPLLFNLFVTNSLGMKQIIFLLGALPLLVPIVIYFLLGYNISFLGYVFMTLSLTSGFINAATIFRLNKEEKEYYVLLMIFVFAVAQTAIRFITSQIYLVYISFFLVVLFTNVLIKKFIIGERV